MPFGLPNFSRCIKEPFPALSHWLGMALAIAGFCALLVAGRGRAWHTVSFGVYGLTLILLYFASAMTHSYYCDEKLARRLDRLDYSAIFLLIAGTYTPMCLLALRGPVGWSLLAVQWLMAIVGIVLVVRGRAQEKTARTILYLLMSWMCLLALPKMWTSLPAGALLWLFAGGLIYTLGAIVYVTNRPNLFPSRFVAHDLWHVMVLLGSACHFILVLEFLS